MHIRTYFHICTTKNYNLPQILILTFEFFNTPKAQVNFKNSLKCIVCKKIILIDYKILHFSHRVILFFIYSKNFIQLTQKHLNFPIFKR